MQDTLKELTEKILKFMNVKSDIAVDKLEENAYKLSISGNDLSFLIGYRGQSLESLQSLLALMALRKAGNPISLTLDINGYKDQRIEKIDNLTKTFIDKVRFFEKDVPLPPMNPWERRQVHMLVAEYDDVTSESTGEGPERRVVLKLKRKK